MLGYIFKAMRPYQHIAMHQTHASNDGACTVCQSTGSFRRERDGTGTFLVCGTCHARQDMGVVA